jgi:hypothetical protein
MALILHRVMRMRLRENKTGLTPERPKFDSSEPFFVILARSLRCKSTA